MFWKILVELFTGLALWGWGWMIMLCNSKVPLGNEKLLTDKVNYFEIWNVSRRENFCYIHFNKLVLASHH